MRYSVVIPVYNAEADLTACLDSVLRDLPDGGEVIVVDDASTDASADIARRYPLRLICLEKNSGQATGRNVGAKAAQGQILVFVDADTEAAPGTIRALIQRLEELREYVAVFGSYDASPSSTALVSQFRNLLHHHVHHHANREARTFWTGCGAMRRDVFLRAGGFDPSARVRAIEDVELGLRVTEGGGRILLDPTIQVKHRKRWTLRSMIRTDVKLRLIPWMRVMHSSRGKIADHGDRRADRWSAVCLAALAPVVLAGWWWMTPLPMLGATLCSWPWHRFLVEQRGIGFMLRALPLHWLYLTYCTACFGYMRVRLAIVPEAPGMQSRPL